MQSEDWGPYRVEEQLGTGGMGEVYRAYDCRLDRWVALKIIRPEVSGGEETRRRFRREARAAARLSHPIIVQIHDIIEREEGDGIVMELVEGETLGRLLKRGPLELDRTVRLGREIAEGLAAAHSRGLVHRDLKADNVVITADDHPKILDFGLAKRLDPTDEQSISIEGRVMGTSHAMSPEQARGHEVDPRSDLFSLGTLLYEMVTGTSPFRRPALAETLTRVCVHQQPPVRKLRPEVPAELSDLIDELLRKKPEDRPQEAQEVALALRQMEPTVSAAMHPVSYPTQVDLPRATATGSRTAVPVAVDEEKATQSLPRGEGTESWWYRTVTLARRPVAWGSALAVIAVATVSVLLLRPAPPPAIQVAVTAPEIRSPASLEEPALLAAGLRVAMNQALLDLEGVTTLAPDQVDAVSGTSQEVARATAADEVVASQLDCRGLSCGVTLNRIGRGGTLISTRAFDVAAEDTLLAAKVTVAQVRMLYANYPPRGDAAQLRVSPEDYEEYVRIFELVARRDEAVGVEELLSRINRVRLSSPDFLPAYLLEARLYRDRYLESRDGSYLQRAYRTIEEARDRAPRDPRPLSALVWIALVGDDREIAEKAISELEELEPMEERLAAQKAHVLEREGKPDEALALMSKAYRTRPSRQNLYNLAQMEYRQGAVTEAREHLESLLQQYPDHFEGRYFLAQLELLNGRPQRAVALYQQLAEKSPETSVLTNLGVAHMLAHQYPQAVAVCRRAYEMDPESPNFTLNLADAELLVGREKEAKELYQRVLELTRGLEDESEPQLLTVRAQALAHLGQDLEAVSQVQRALQLAPDHPQVVYEAALVYTLIGERSSALVFVEKSIDLGVESGWFHFPWFEPLWTLPQFQAVTGTTQDPGGRQRNSS